MKKQFLFSLGASLLLVACQQPQNYQVEPLKVETEVVKSNTSAQGRSYVGIVEEEESVSVSFTGMGTLKRVLVSEGQNVCEGQLLAELDDTQARNMLDAAKATATQAEDAIGRYKQLYEKGSLAEAKWIEAQSRLDQVQATLKSAEKNLADCKLYAPMAGVVGARQLAAGATVLPSQPVLTIYKINNVKVKVSVPESEIAAIGTKTPSRIFATAANLDLEGGSIEKGVVADQLTHTYNIRINLANPDKKLLPGMVCNVELQTGEAAEQSASLLSLPVLCIQQAADGQHFVWIVTGGVAHRQNISLGALQGNRVEVSGIAEGTQVIVSGYQKVSEGQRVVES